MRRKSWYYFVCLLVEVGFLCFFKKFTVVGRKNISKKRSTLFLPNHQNTFLDALTIAVSYKGISHYMARADIFSSPRLIWLMSTVNLRPIYRIRDGKKAVTKNEQVFHELEDFLNDGEAVMIHPEGTHNLEYRLRPLHKGFTRLAFGFLERFPNKELDIIPVGINYGNHTDFRQKASIHYGKPIDARTYFEMQDRASATSALINDVSSAMKGLITHIEPVEEYQEKYAALRAAGADFSNPIETQALLKRLELGETLPTAKPKKPAFIERMLYPLVYANNIVFVLLWKKLKPIFKDEAWHSAIKLCLGTFLGPLVYLLQTVIVYWIFGPVWALLYLFLSLSTLPILRLGQAHTSY